MQKVLLVEDSENFGKLFCEFLKQYFSVDWVKDYYNFLQIFNPKEYDIVISDLWFPYKQGTGNIEEGKKLLNEIAQKVNQHQKDKKFKTICSRGRNTRIKSFPMMLDLFQQGLSFYEFNQPLGFRVLQHCMENNVPVTLNTADHFFKSEQERDVLRFGSGIYPILVKGIAYLFGDDFHRCSLYPSEYPKQVNRVGGRHIILTEIQSKNNFSSLQEITAIYEKIMNKLHEYNLKLFGIL